ncbi:MAG: hypothetical protein AABW57_00510 [Nanoarchaeota archaeon]
MIREGDLKLSKKTKKELEEARKRIASGKFLTLEQVKKRLGIE